MARANREMETIKYRTEYILYRSRKAENSDTDKIVVLPSSWSSCGKETFSVVKTTDTMITSRSNASPSTTVFHLFSFSYKKVLHVWIKKTTVGAHEAFGAFLLNGTRVLHSSACRTGKRSLLGREKHELQSLLHVLFTVCVSVLQNDRGAGGSGGANTSQLYNQSQRTCSAPRSSALGVPSAGLRSELLR